MIQEYYVARMKEVEERQQPGFLVRSDEPLFRDNANGMWRSMGVMKFDCRDFEDLPELQNLRWEDEPVKVSVDIKLSNING